jgi:hypothetical protein
MLRNYNRNVDRMMKSARNSKGKKISNPMKRYEAAIKAKISPVRKDLTELKQQVR